VTRRFASRVTIVNERTGESADAKSVLGIVGLDIRLNDRCTIACDGADEREAVAAVTRFLEADLARCDEAPPSAPARPEGRPLLPLPPLLRMATAELLRGTCVVPGIGRGRVVRLGALTIPDALIRESVADRDSEIARLDAGLRALA